MLQKRFLNLSTKRIERERDISNNIDREEILNNFASANDTVV